MSIELDNLANICHTNISHSAACIQYLQSRGVSDSFVDKYKIGYFPQSISTLTRHIDEEFLLKNNIISNGNNSDFSSYYFLTIPLINEYNDCVGISGRTLLSSQEREYLGIPKYKNSSFKKSNFLFGLNFSRKKIIKSNNVFIVEGYFDHISMDQAGIKNSVAICGASFSQSHFYKLSKYCDKFTFILDSDDAGQKSISRIYSKYINKGVKLRFLKIPKPYKDIDEYLSNKKNNIHTFFHDFKQFIPED
jgi:DNA primase